MGGDAADLTGELCAYVAGFPASRVPPDVVERAKLHVLDTIGAMLSGSVLEPGRLIIDFVRQQGGVPAATVLASRVRTNAVQAALANGTMAHADETDDVHHSAQTHPGAAVVPAALALAEAEHRSGGDLVTAVVIGYDVICRVSRALDRPWMYERGLNFRSISAGFGSAAAASRTLGLSEQQTRFAMAFSATQVSGLHTWRQDPRHVDKAVCLAGLPARNGVTAALWAREGFTATSRVFDGPDNLFQAFCEQPHPEELTRGLGTDFEILGTGIKKYPGGQPVQATLEAYFTLVGQYGLKEPDIRQIVVRLPESEADTVNDRMMPDINCQYLLAVAMLDGAVGFAAAHDFERMLAADVLALKERVRVVADAELTARHPAVRAAIVEVTTSDGRCLRQMVDRTPGGPRNPLTREEIEAKFLSLSAPVLGNRRAQNVVEQVRDLERLPDVAGLARLMRA